MKHYYGQDISPKLFRYLSDNQRDYVTGNYLCNINKRFGVAYTNDLIRTVLGSDWYEQPYSEIKKVLSISKVQERYKAQYNPTRTSLNKGAIAERIRAVQAQEQSVYARKLRELIGKKGYDTMLSNAANRFSYSSHPDYQPYIKSILKGVLMMQQYGGLTKREIRAKFNDNPVVLISVADDIRYCVEQVQHNHNTRLFEQEDLDFIKRALVKNRLSDNDARFIEQRILNRITRYYWSDKSTRAKSAKALSDLYELHELTKMMSELGVQYDESCYPTRTSLNYGTTFNRQLAQAIKKAYKLMSKTHDKQTCAQVLCELSSVIASDNSKKNSFAPVLCVVKEEQ